MRWSFSTCQSRHDLRIAVDSLPIARLRRVTGWKQKNIFRADWQEIWVNFDRKFSIFFARQICVTS